jgi:hypothetical protein
MSLPNEIVNAQQRIWDMFVNGEIPKEKWPRHFISGGQLHGLYFWLDELKKENEELKSQLQIKVASKHV